MQSFIESISGPDCPTIPRLLEARAAAQPSALALRRKRRGIWQRITWRDYYEMSECCALGLVRLDLRRGDCVAILAENTPAWLYAEMGVLSFGGRLLLLDPTMQKAAVLQALRNSDAKALICGDQEQVDKVLESLQEGEKLPKLKNIVFINPRGVRNYSHPLLQSFDEVINRGKTSEPDAKARLDLDGKAETADAIAVIAVTREDDKLLDLLPLSHRDLLVSSARLARTLKFREGSMSVLSYISLANVVEQQASPMLQLLVGSTVNFGESVETVADDLVEVAPTFFVGFPEVWDRLKRRIESRIGSTRYLNRKLLTAALQSAARHFPGPAAKSADGHSGKVAVPFVLRRVLRTMGLREIDTALCVGGQPSPATQNFFHALGLPLATIDDVATADSPQAIRDRLRGAQDGSSPPVNEFGLGNLANAPSGLPQ